MKKTDRLRVVVLTDTFLPHAGGSRFYYYNLFKRIAGLGHEVTIETSKVPGWQEFDTREQTATFKIKRRFTPLPDLSYSQLPKIAGPLLTAFVDSVFHRPDIIHCGDLYPGGMIGVILKKLLGIPYVAYCHGEDITLTDKRRFQPRLRNFIYRNSDAVVANGAFAIENLIRIGIQRDKIHKITPGLDTSVFYPVAADSSLRQHYNIESNELVVMTVARLVPRKGHARVMRALAALRSEVSPFKYVIVGRGSIEAELRDLANQLNLRDKVVFAGFVADDKLNQHYNMADIVVMPNTEEAGDIEGFGMVFLEANAAGKPVIGGRSGGTAEAVAEGESGFLVDSDEDFELRDALQRLLMDASLRESMGAKGLQRARTEFDWDTRAALLGQISADIVASKR
ncbi:glycosyltransferase family 4 protein [Edaphobacter paludis]|uniref:Glycosyltransferase family 4 protein n=1 Tax=Edaphobacter paludis TaxID=3035702 RepID=A0AAU7CWZ3_9BACT